MGMIDVNNVAIRAGVSIATVYAWTRKGWITGHQVSETKKNWYDEDEIEKFLQSKPGPHVTYTRPDETVPEVESCYPINLIRVVLRIDDDREPDADGPDIWDVNIREFRNYISKLSDREQRVIELRFHMGMSFDEAGAIMNVTKERVRQIQIKALLKLEYFVRNGCCEMVPRQELIKAKETIKALELMMQQKDILVVKHQNPENDNSDVMLLEEMNLSIRCYNCLKRAGFNSLNDILRFDQLQKTGENDETGSFRYSNWLEIRNFGRCSFKELRKKVYDLCGYTIGENIA